MHEGDTPPPPTRPAPPPCSRAQLHAAKQGLRLRKDRSTDLRTAQDYDFESAQRWVRVFVCVCGGAAGSDSGRRERGLPACLPACRHIRTHAHTLHAPPPPLPPAAPTPPTTMTSTRGGW